MTSRRRAGSRGRDGLRRVWLLSVWRTGPAGQRVSRTNREWRREFEETLPDLSEEDIAGSGFAITGYTVHPGLGGDAALARLRERLRARGLLLMLDFVPNHTGLDHPWVEDHPEYYVSGTEIDLAREPQNYTWRGDRLLAHGRDPYFDGWPDTLQLDYGNPATQEAMLGELLKIAGQCDGVRCDMAMLILPDVFERTWGRRPAPFWPLATGRVRERVPGFCFMAEVYWDLEWTMLQQGFDYAYDKRLYDRLREGHARPAREHLHAGLDYQEKLARFLENHDEPRAAESFAPGAHEAAAVPRFSPRDCDSSIRASSRAEQAHLAAPGARAAGARRSGAQQFYDNLLAVLRQPTVRVRVAPARVHAAWDGNWTSECFITLVLGNREPIGSSPSSTMPGTRASVMSAPVSRPRRARGAAQGSDGPASYDREGSDWSRGLYLDLRPGAITCSR